METKTGTLTGIGGLQLFYQGWLPEGAPKAPKATVFLCHGYAEHGGRYAHLGEYLAARGFALWAMDLRGHGRSEGVRAHVDRFDMFVEDMRTFVDHIAPPGKTFLYGHSMGSVMLMFAIRYPELIDGIIVTGTTLAPGEGVPPLLVRMAKLLSALFPKMPLMELESAALSHDPEVNAAYDNDPLVYRGKMRARIGAEILRAGEYLRANLDKITVPILIMHGTADRLVDVAGAQMVYDGTGSEDKTLKLWEGMYHEVHNEPAVKDELFALVIDWLGARS